MRIARSPPTSARLSEPWAIDSAETDGPHLCLDITYRLRAAGDDRYLVTMVVDSDYLTKESTVYPVRIDPSISIYDPSNAYRTLYSDGVSDPGINAIGLLDGTKALMCLRLPVMNT